MAIRWDKMTLKSQEAIQAATELASQNGNPEILPVHLLAALLQDKEGIVIPIMNRIGVGPERLLAEANTQIDKLPKVSGGGYTQANLSDAASKAFSQAFKEAENFKDEYVSTEHLLLALTQQKGDEAQQMLAAAGATHEAILKALTTVRG